MTTSLHFSSNARSSPASCVAGSKPSTMHRLVDALFPSLQGDASFFTAAFKRSYDTTDLQPTTFDARCKFFILSKFLLFNLLDLSSTLNFSPSCFIHASFVKHESSRTSNSASMLFDCLLVSKVMVTFFP